MGWALTSEKSSSDVRGDKGPVKGTIGSDAGAGCRKLFRMFHTYSDCVGSTAAGPGGVVWYVWLYG